jgi:hypothetical protein
MNNPTHRPYRVDATQKEKFETLKNDQRVRSGSTFLDHTHSEEGGRFAKPQTIVGSTSEVQYPMAAPNWSADPTGVEPPLGYDINEAPIVGEAFELGEAVTPSALAQGEANTQASVATQSELAPPNHLVDLAGEGERSIVGLPSNDDVAPAPASSKPKPTRRSR